MKELSSQELRIGNYVEYGGVINKVYLLSHIYFQVESTDMPIFKASKNRAARPIPLTEEWLLKFGFNAKSVNHNFTIDSDIDFQISSGQRVIETNERSSFYLENNFGTKINYVHQLQNLYFALTGEELTLEP